VVSLAVKRQPVIVQFAPQLADAPSADPVLAGDLGRAIAAAKAQGDVAIPRGQ